MCDTPACTLMQGHAGFELSLELSLPGKRERKHTAKYEQHRNATRTVATTCTTSAEAVRALAILGAYLDSCGGAASMVEGWSASAGPPRAHGSRQDLTFFSPCGKTFRSKAEAARFLGLKKTVRNRTVASSSSAEAVQALSLLGAHLESGGGAASMVEGWSASAGPPRTHGSRQDLTFFSPCGKSFRSKAEVARFLGMEIIAPAKQKRTLASSDSVDAVQALSLLGSHLASCGGAASMVEGWSVGVGPPRDLGSGLGSRQDLTYFSLCGKSFRSKAEVARFLGLGFAPAKQNRTVASSTSAEAKQVLVNLGAHLESCGGAATMVEGWSVGIGPPRAHGSRQDATFFSPCGKSFRSKAEVARFLGMEMAPPGKQNRTVASATSAEAVRALGLLGAHLESCGGAATMVEGWSVGVGTPRPTKSPSTGYARPRQDVTFFSPCGQMFRSKAEAARFLGLESGAPRVPQRLLMHSGLGIGPTSPQDASGKRAKRATPAELVGSPTLWVNAMVVDADDECDGVDAAVVDDDE